MRPAKIFLLIIITAFACLMCTKVDVPDGTPRCIKKMVREIQDQPVRNPPAEVWQYDYQGKKVYYIPPYCCDIPGILYDEDCNLICQPDGGFTGTGDGRCTDFFANRSNPKLIWKDDR